MSLPIKCATQSYAWGKIGSDSQVALLTKAGNPQFNLEEDKPYAELWMGTHPNGPSLLEGEGSPLKDYIKSHPETLGTKIPAQFGNDLPFLFKVLSVNKALSIQAHPHKSMAEQLHRDFPNVYKDPNHKPEMAIAVTPFEGLCGFRPIQEIVSFLKDVPELRSVIGQENCDDFIKAAECGGPLVDPLKTCFRALMTCSPEAIASRLTVLVNRLNLEAQKSTGITELVLRLHQQFPGDVGCFCAFLLNHMKLQPGEAMFLEANLPHAYLSGDCMECMAASDNVVRAGLTPKFKDVDTLCSMLNYTCKKPSENLFTYKELGPGLRLYNPPVPDFAVIRMEGSLQFSGKNYGKGSVVFIPANENIGEAASVDGDTLAFRALCLL